MSYASSVSFNTPSLYRLWTVHACLSHHITLDLTAEGRGSLTHTCSENPIKKKQELSAELQYYCSKIDDEHACTKIYAEE